MRKHQSDLLNLSQKDQDEALTKIIKNSSIGVSDLLFPWVSDADWVSTLLPQ